LIQIYRELLHYDFVQQRLAEWVLENCKQNAEKEMPEEYKKKIDELDVKHKKFIKRII